MRRVLSTSHTGDTVREGHAESGSQYLQRNTGHSAWGGMGPAWRAAEVRMQSRPVRMVPHECTVCLLLLGAGWTGMRTRHAYTAGMQQTLDRKSTWRLQSRLGGPRTYRKLRSEELLHAWLVQLRSMLHMPYTSVPGRRQITGHWRCMGAAAS